jgi:hypothetical protein
MTDSLYFLLVIGLVGIVVSCFGAMVYFLARELRAGGMTPAHTQSDLTNMMILFQTMRDILTQQKDLAREFNISIDKKVNEVRKLIQSTGDVRSDLERTKRELAALATQTRKDLSTLERRLQGVDNRTAAAAGDTLAAPETGPVTGEAGDDEAADEDPDAAETPLEVIPDPGPEKGDLDFIDRWRAVAAAAVEIGDDDAEADPFADENENGNGHGDALTEEEVEDTRAAYRDLLSLQPAGPARMRGPSSSEIVGAGRDGVVGQYLTPIQKRVYEYSDAGMRVPEIARELGVGKGEVRLILSLRQDRDR